MPRLALPTDAELSDAARSVLALRPAAAVYRAVAHAPSMLAPVMQMATACFEQLSLSDRLREMVILRVAMHHASAYEAHHHRALAARAGVDAAQIDALLSSAPFAAPDPLETATIRFVDELVGRGDVEAATFERVAAALGSRGTTELALLIGFYRMVATFLAAIGLEPDALTSVQLRDASPQGHASDLS